ncbi:serine/threonine-protein kinase [Nonomuraea rubra]|uniref:serine/threonine-protein kinase n=1 Tax=Nonomuraea rubra TaxID=46180 RepID=UPI0036165197
MSDSAGLVVGGRYRLLRTIGKGGMGMVWHAHDEVLGRDVAVKEVLPPPNMTGPERDEFAVRTFREARAAGRVAHPGVATVYDVLEERGHPWIVMQLVHSRTLGALIRDEGPMPPAKVAGIGLQLLEALRAAHAAGVLHRDVKPDNVLLTDDGRAVLTDFGIATTEDEAPVTRTGILIGTPAFMAPERAAGGRARPASDMWSLGVTLYMAVEGDSPFQRDNALATLGAVMHAEPRPPARAGALAPVLDGLLHKDPSGRLSLDDAERRLAAILTGEPPGRTGPVTAPSGRRRSSRRLLPLAAIAGGALLVGLVTGGAAWWARRPREAVSPSPAPVVVTTEATTVYESPTPELETTRPESSPAPQGVQPRATTTPPPRSTPPPTRDQPRSPSPSGNKKGSTKEPKPTRSEEEDGDPGRVEGSDHGEGDSA